MNNIRKSISGDTVAAEWETASDTNWVPAELHNGFSHNLSLSSSSFCPTTFPDRLVQLARKSSKGLSQKHVRMEGLEQGGRRLEGWPNTAARLACWRRVTQQGVILYVMDGPCRLPWRTTPLAPVRGWSVTKCIQNIVMSYVTQEKHSSIDPCLLSGLENDKKCHLEICAKCPY